MGGGNFALMKDASAPIVVKGRHWGGVRCAAGTRCRTTDAFALLLPTSNLVMVVLGTTIHEFACNVSVFA
jgi:hypothetical protein